MSLSHSDLLQWFTIICLELVAVWLASTHKIWRIAPAFYTLICAYAGTSLILLYCAFETSHRVYFYAYWYIEALLASLILAATIEVTTAVTRPGRIVPADAFAVLTNFVLATAAVISSILTVFDVSGKSQLRLFIALDKACAFTACALMACTLLFSVIFSIRWKPLFSAIAFGIAVNSVVPAAFNRMDAYFPGAAWKTYWISNAAAFGAALLIWMAGIVSPTRNKLSWGNDLEQIRELLLDSARMRRHLERTVG